MTDTVFLSSEMKGYSTVCCERRYIPELAADPQPASSQCELLIEAPAVILGFKETLEMAKQDPTFRTDKTKLTWEAIAVL